MNGFDDRWRRLARSATRVDASSLPADLARRARQRPAEPIPFVPSRWGWTLGAAAALLTAVLLPTAIDLTAPVMTTAEVRAPGLPPPPTVESPGHYLALVRSAWKGLSP